MARKDFSILLMLCSVSTVRAESVVCRLARDLPEKTSICTGKETTETPWSKKGDMTAPRPNSISYTKLSSADGFLLVDLIWTQKRIDMAAVEGYYMEVSFGDYYQFEFVVNKEKFNRSFSGNEAFVTFKFEQAVFAGMETHVRLFSLPMYLENHKSQDVRLTIEREAPEPLEYYVSAEGESSIKPYQQYNYDNDITEEPPQQVTRNCETQQSMKSFDVTIIACVFTGLATVILMGIASLIYKLNKKGTHIKGRLSDGGDCCQERDEAKPKVLIVASMAVNEHGSKDEFYKKAALCLKSTLEKSNDYDVSCNLLTTTELSEKGVAIWAHELIKCHDKIVVLCSPSIVRNATEHTNCPFDAKRLVHTDASLQILQSFVRNRHLSDAKLVLVCVDDPAHKCLGTQLLSGLENCKRINLTHEFPKFIDALSLKGKYPAEAKIASMWGDFREMLQKNRSQNSQHAKRTATPPPIYSHFKEVQYDSVYSSRCNSHSTESISSHDETGFHECSEERSHYKEQYDATGARPKTSVRDK